MPEAAPPQWSNAKPGEAVALRVTVVPDGYLVPDAGEIVPLPDGITLQAKVYCVGTTFRKAATTHQFALMVSFRVDNVDPTPG